MTNQPLQKGSGCSKEFICSTPANIEEEEKASMKSTRSGSHGSTEDGYSSSDSPRWSTVVSESFPCSQDFLDVQELHESLHDVATPPGLEQEVKEELPGWADANIVGFPEWCSVLNTQWKERAAIEEKDSCECEWTGAQDGLMEESGLPSHLMGLLSHIDEDDEQNKSNFRPHKGDEIKISVDSAFAVAPAPEKTPTPPLTPTTASALLFQLKEAIDRHVKAATPTLSLSAPPSTASQVVQQTSPACMSQTNRPKADPRMVPPRRDLRRFSKPGARVTFDPTKAARPNQGSVRMPNRVLPQGVDALQTKNKKKLQLEEHLERFQPSKAPGSSVPVTRKASSPLTLPVPMCAKACPASAPAMPPPPIHAAVFSAPAPGLPPPPATSPRLPASLPGIPAPPSEPPSATMPCVPAPLQTVVEVRKAFTSMGECTISVAPCDLVEIFRQDPSGWAYGRKANSADKVPGWFPAWTFKH